MLGSAVVWALGTEKACWQMNLFRAPVSPGFGGRQAFSKGNDLFYASLRSVTGAAKDLMDHYDEGRRRGKMPDNCVIAFPVVVVDGELFEASFNEQQGKMEIEPANDVRCHWRGSPSWNLHATVDVVTLKGLDAFLSIRREEMRRLLDLMSNASADIAKCFETASTDEFDAKYRTSTLHPLLREAITQIKVKLGASKFDALAPTAPSQGDDQ